MQNRIRLYARIHLTAFMLWAIFFELGVGLATPDTQSVTTKWLILGLPMLVHALIIVYVWVKPSESMDDRARHNIYLAGFFSFCLTNLLLALIVLTAWLPALAAYVPAYAALAASLGWMVFAISYGILDR